MKFLMHVKNIYIQTSIQCLKVIFFYGIGGKTTPFSTNLLKVAYSLQNITLCLQNRHTSTCCMPIFAFMPKFACDSLLTLISKLVFWQQYAPAMT